MTDSSKSNRRRSRRTGPSRVPPTIDLTATEVAAAPPEGAPSGPDLAPTPPPEGAPSGPDLAPTPPPEGSPSAGSPDAASAPPEGSPSENPPEVAPGTPDETVPHPLIEEVAAAGPREGEPTPEAASPPPSGAAFDAGASEPAAEGPRRGAAASVPPTGPKLSEGGPAEAYAAAGPVNSEAPAPPAGEGQDTSHPARDAAAESDAAHAEPGRDSLDIATPPAGAAGPDPAIRDARPEPRRGAGFGSLATAGLLGGLVGAGLVFGLQTWQRTQGGTDPRLAGLEQQLGTFARQDAVRALEGRIAANEAARSDLAQRVQAAQALAERSAARAEEAASRPAGTAAAPQDNAALPDLANRLTALETQLRDSLQGATQGFERRIAEQDQKLAAALQPLERRLAEQDDRLAAALQPLERRLGELDQRVAAATQPVERRLGEQEQRLAALARQVAEGGSDATRAGTRVVLADRLDDALRDGAPFAEVLAALRRFTPDPAKLAPLDPFAQGGAPNAATLAQSFKPIGERLRREARPAGEDWTDRLLRMADKVVTVRAVDDPGETGVPATVSRIEDALARGAIGEAAAAWDSLPEPARQASAQWGQQIKQRAAAEAAARTVAADAAAALSQATR